MTTNDILSKQKNLQTLRKAVTKAKTRVSEAKRHIREYKSWLTSSQAPQDQQKLYVERQIVRYESDLTLAEEELAQAQATLAAAEATVPAAKPTQFDNILKWFSGAALVKVKDALELVEASIAHGSWVPGASRKVWAALKPNVAKKTIKVDSHYSRPVQSAIDSAIRYGSFKALAQVTLVEATKALPDNALEFYIDFKPLVDAMVELDATRPVPVFTTMNASPTVSAELKRQDAVSVEVAKIVYEKREGVDENGKKFFHWVGIIKWPKGIRHNTSRYALGTDHNAQCHACGHAIRNPFNWVPLVLTTEAGAKKSLWVGRDCAKTLFGVDMTGDLELAEGQR